ncbi:hypothetical protein AGLY_015195 [Aphis glycines]|uniref:Transmembrane protein n=1 Tax=Aphis glycines TaxID=307491 RepID=A0A6G0T2P8_APHGL|nr:hypothetical protein AGLY_015195 [Aphis glycines]
MSITRLYDMLQYFIRFPRISNLVMAFQRYKFYLQDLRSKFIKIVPKNYSKYQICFRANFSSILRIYHFFDRITSFENKNYCLFVCLYNLYFKTQYSTISSFFKLKIFLISYNILLFVNYLIILLHNILIWTIWLDKFGFLNFITIISIVIFRVINKLEILFDQIFQLNYTFF